MDGFQYKPLKPFGNRWDIHYKYRGLTQGVPKWTPGHLPKPLHRQLPHLNCWQLHPFRCSGKTRESSLASFPSLTPHSHLWASSVGSTSTVTTENKATITSRLVTAKASVPPWPPTVHSFSTVTDSFKTLVRSRHFSAQIHGMVPRVPQSQRQTLGTHLGSIQTALLQWLFQEKTLIWCCKLKQLLFFHKTQFLLKKTIENIFF